MSWWSQQVSYRRTWQEKNHARVQFDRDKSDKYMVPILRRILVTRHEDYQEWSSSQKHLDVLASRADENKARQCMDGWFSLAELPSHFSRSKFEVLNPSRPSSFMRHGWSPSSLTQFWQTPAFCGGDEPILSLRIQHRKSPGARFLFEW